MEEMKIRELTIKRQKVIQILGIITFSILILLFLKSTFATDNKSGNVETLNSNQSIINKSVIKEKYPPDTKLFEIFNNDLVDTNPQEIAKNIEDISKKYNIDINNVSENITGEYNNGFNEDIITQSPDEEKILLIRFSGKMTIKNIIDFYRSGIDLYYPVSRNTVIVKIKAENITKLRSYPFINGIREYKPADKINPDDKAKIDQMNQSENKNATDRSNSLLKLYIWPLGKGKDLYVQDLQQLGVEKISYDNTAKVYYAEALPPKIYLILNLTWVRKVDLQKEAVAY